jgi:immune inhibitor A
MSQSTIETTESVSTRTEGVVTGTLEVIVILIEFQDVTHSPNHDENYFENLLFSESNPRSLYSYYQEVSYDQASISGVIIGWYQSSYNIEYYGADGHKVDWFNGPVFELAREAVKLADDAGFDFSPYDKDDNGYIDHIIIVHAGAGQETGGGAYGPNAIWSHHWGMLLPEKVDGVYAADYSMIAESSPVGTIAHEFGHDLGLPDLYDNDGTSQGIGSWGIMGCGAWQMGGDVPTHPCAWSKVFLGWVNPKIISTNKIDLSLNSVESSNLDTIIKISITTTEYFLLENRCKVKFDQYLPGEGLLIWHIDDSVGDTDLYGVNDDEEHKRVDLEEADGRDDLDARVNSGDHKDLYYSGNADKFTPSTVPDSDSYSGDSSGISIVNIGVTGETMRFSILLGGNSAPVAIAGGPYEVPVNADVIFSGQDSFDPDGGQLSYIWDFDASDGLQVDSTEINPAYAYSAVGTYTVTLIVSDGELNSEPSVTMADVISTEETLINLLPGWNLISLYLQPLDTSCDSVLSSIDGKYDSIWTYDTMVAGWQKYIPNDPPQLNNLDKIESGRGYLIMMNRPGVLIIQGVQPATAVLLKAGRNLVGYNSRTTIPVEDCISPIASNCNAVWTYDSEADKWLWRNLNGSVLLNGLEYMTPGSGYWIEVNEDCVWDISMAAK